MKRLITLFALLILTTSCNPKPTYYVVTWVNYDGTILEIDEDVLASSLPQYDGDVPTREKDEEYYYHFVGWDKELSPVNSDITYTAIFEKEQWFNRLTFSHQSGFYDEPFYLTIEAPLDYEIYYTLDNTDPDINAFKYEKPISITDASSKENYFSLKQNISSLDVYYPSVLLDKCQIIKVIGIDKVTNLSTPIYQLNYFVNFDDKEGYLDMPVITLNINEEDLFDYEKGIYMTGKIYDESVHEGYPETYPANYNQTGVEWERKANFKYFDKNKELSLEQDIGVRIHGGWSRAFNQKSFNLYARKDYSGSSTFGKAFFNDINAHSLMLRSGGYRDTDITKIRDSLVHDFSKDELFDTQSSEPVIVFLNGEYWGIYNLQERYSDNYVKEHHNIKKSNVLIIKNDKIDEGDESDYHLYEELYDFFLEEELSSNDKYELAKKYIDVDEFASYMATQLYIGNIDWPANNIRMYRDVSNENAKWHFMIYDTDDSMNILSHMCNANIDPFLRTSHWKSGPLESDCIVGLMFSKLIENDEFKALFRKTFLRIGEETFSIEKVNEYLNDKSSLLAIPMIKNYQRFVNNEYDEQYFLSSVGVIKTFFSERYECAVGFLNEHIPE